MAPRSNGRRTIRWLGLSALVGGCGLDVADVTSSGDDPRPPTLQAENCTEVNYWDPSWVKLEDEVLRLTNEARARGHDCDTEGRFGPAPALRANAKLRCAARLHSAYMADHGEFNHIEADNGSDPFERIDATGYTLQAAGENIAVGQATPVEVVASWLESDGHCRNIMDPAYEELGVGFAIGSGAPVDSDEAPYWTQEFAAPF